LDSAVENSGVFALLVSSFKEGCKTWEKDTLITSRVPVHLFKTLVWLFLQDYKQKYPDVIVLDPPEAIQHLRNRQSMLQDVAQLDLCDCGGLALFSLTRM
jgi:hypothetical protein